MSKQNKEPSTPESRAEKRANKQMLRKVFTSTFFKAFAICLAVLLIYSVCYIAFINPNSVGANTVNPISDTNAAESAVVQNNNGSASSGDASGDAAATGDTNAAAVTELSASSSKADILSYFNTAINNVKPKAKQVTLNYEKNSEAGGISGEVPSSLVSVANNLIANNMGEKDLSKLDPGLVNATTADQKNAMFPVETQTWSSKLTEEDIQSATVTEANGTYTITITVKEDPVSADTDYGVGHHGKAFSVIRPGIIAENAPGVENLLKDIKTGHKDGKIVVTVDKATGNVTHANYYFVWTLQLTVLGMTPSIPFGLEKDFTIAW